MKIRQWTAALLTAGFLMSGVGAGAAEIDPAKPDCETAVIGDVNRDGLVQVDDATLVQCIVAGIVTADDLLTLRLADADGSGVCDIADATAIQQSCADIDAGASLVGKPYDEVYGADTVYPQKQGKLHNADKFYHNRGIWPGWDSTLMVGAALRLAF